MARLLANGRPQHIPSQTDTVVRFVQEHVALFWCLRDLGSKGTPLRLLHETAFLRGWLGECGALLGFALFG